jgi:hypothetical protein
MDALENWSHEEATLRKKIDEQALALESAGGATADQLQKYQTRIEEQTANLQDSKLQLEQQIRSSQAKMLQDKE